MSSNPQAKVIDFDAWRAERLAKEGEDKRPPILFRIGGEEYPIPPEPPASIVLDVVRLKEAIGSDAEVSVEALMAIGDAIFGKEAFGTMLRVNRLHATELGDLIIQAFNAWPENLVDTEDAVPNRKTRRGSEAFRLIADWALVEADFQREYDLDLSDPPVLARMSWRRFSTLLRGLGPQSAAASRAVVRRYRLDRDSSTTTVTGTKQQVSAAFVGMFGGKRKDPGAKTKKGPKQG